MIYPHDHDGRFMCEHCDGENSPVSRSDPLRGNVCSVCDSALDEMEKEENLEKALTE